ncbi:MAG: DnaJ domain-containing protein [Bacteroidales bacterium]|nr:DnaJ domain-containing protein [Bacteroidales bacterium]MCF8345136.1 DnaJ domain-containing protein [Bacteroidales bacterium]MCF8351310.1 DnaJ domain-containing protein [Bacteroidales bacterium]MCF8376898.1 DnaJ domain-containing protein [Bacteroidales bacterium]MCF8400833.1 DnaJ domain-containing protein [Bacteroidales bacterium]
MPKNYYHILRIDKDATAEEIRKAYRRLSHLYHPDKCSATSDAGKFIEVNEAYKVLNDPDKKRDYDQSTDEGNVPINRSGRMGEESSYRRPGSYSDEIFIEMDDYISELFHSLFGDRPKRSVGNFPPGHIHYDDLVR